MYASRYGHIDLAKYLLTKGANPHHQTQVWSPNTLVVYDSRVFVWCLRSAQHGKEAFVFACEGNEVACAAWLLDTFAYDVEAPDTVWLVWEKFCCARSLCC